MIPQNTLHFFPITRITLQFEKNISHLEVSSYRYVPPLSALGSHTDLNLGTRNKNNSCFCLKDDGFSCFKSGVFNMEPCKVTPDTPRGSPIALSWPHFYQADPSYLAAVSGLKPTKDKHQFYVDISPQFGIPLAIRPRLQINAIIRKDEDIQIMRLVEYLLEVFFWPME
jgi:scavenger receptor class B protein 1